MQAEETPYWCGHDAHVPGDCPWAAEETPGLSEARQVLETALRLHAANEEDVAIGLEWLDTYADEARRPLLDALGAIQSHAEFEDGHICEYAIQIIERALGGDSGGSSADDYRDFYGPGDARNDA